VEAPSGQNFNYSVMSVPPDSTNLLAGCYLKIIGDIEILFAAHHRGVVVSGPAGSGKTSRLVRGLLAASWYANRAREAHRAKEKWSEDMMTSIERLGASLVGWHELSPNFR
jgi:hypothetical protein